MTESTIWELSWFLLFIITFCYYKTQTEQNANVQENIVRREGQNRKAAYSCFTVISIDGMP